jgi:hypothetical protein
MGESDLPKVVIDIQSRKKMGEKPKPNKRNQLRKHQIDQPSYRRPRRSSELLLPPLNSERNQIDSVNTKL